MSIGVYSAIKVVRVFEPIRIDSSDHRAPLLSRFDILSYRLIIPEMFKSIPTIISIIWRTYVPDNSSNWISYGIRYIYIIFASKCQLIMTIMLLRIQYWYSPFYSQQLAIYNIIIFTLKTFYFISFNSHFSIILCNISTRMLCDYNSWNKWAVSDLFQYSINFYSWAGA